MTKEVTGAKKTPEPPAQHWAESLANRAVERRRQRAAQQAAAAAAAEARQNVPLDVLSRRFAALAAPIAEAVSHWAAVTGTPIDTSGVTPGSMRLSTYGVGWVASVDLCLLPDAGGVRVAIRGHGRGDEHVVDLDADDFEPGPIARTIAEEFLGHAEAITELETLQEGAR